MSVSKKRRLYIEGEKVYEVVAFYLFAALTIGFFLVAVMSKNALYALSSLAGGMVFVGGFFFLLDAEFVGVVQIVVYTGSVMALYAFGMMFFDTTRDVSENITSKRFIYTLAILSCVLLVVIVVTPLAAPIGAEAPIDAALSNPHALGRVLFTKYLVAFELAAVMLLVAMIAGIVLASKKLDERLAYTEAKAQKEKK
jgi:NADH-quinone oxidoreductase subunit J